MKLRVVLQFWAQKILVLAQWGHCRHFSLPLVQNLSGQQIPNEDLRCYAMQNLNVTRSTYSNEKKIKKINQPQWGKARLSPILRCCTSHFPRPQTVAEIIERKIWPLRWMRQEVKSSKDFWFIELRHQLNSCVKLTQVGIPDRPPPGKKWKKKKKKK